MSVTNIPNFGKISKALSALPQLVESGFLHDARSLELTALRLMRELRADFPSVAEGLAAILAHHNSGLTATRSIMTQAAPTDADTHANLLRIKQPSDSPKPVFAPEVWSEIDSLIRERKEAETLIRNGSLPPKALLLLGPPGTGKTMLAEYLASTLGLELAYLDLATAVSSYLGKTGFNLRKVFDFASRKPTLLFLDEFDALAKKRDDPTDVGELKRIVNVLLKEMEQWPTFSLLVAATNHRDMLDRAIFRRFDRIIEIPEPGAKERSTILEDRWGKDFLEIEKPIHEAIVEMTAALSGSDLVRMADAVKRRMILDKITLPTAAFEELTKLNGKLPKDAIPGICKLLKKQGLTLQQISQIVKLSPSTISYHTNN